MKLLSSALSPFAARVRIAIYARSLPVEITPSNMWLPSGQKSPEYLAINPLGKVPTLVLDDGTALPESDTIVEFLADAFPKAGLRPANPQDAARGRLIARAFELYVMTPGWGVLFSQLNPQARDEAALDGAMTKMDEGLRCLNLFMTDDAYAVGDGITTADCALVPFLFFQGLLVQTCGKDDLLAKHGKVAGYLGRMQQDPVMQRVLAEMREGLASSRLSFLLPQGEKGQS